MKTLILLFAIGIALSCHKQSTPQVIIKPPVDTVVIPKDSPVITRDSIKYAGTKITYFGNSITGGTGASNPARRWTMIVTKRLNAIEDNKAVAGSTMADMLTYLPKVPMKTDSLSLLVISYGINDILYDKPLEKFISGYDSVMRYVTLVKQWPAAKVLLISPNWFVPRTAITEEKVLSFIAAVKATADKYHTLYVAPYSICKDRPYLFLAAPDGVHPNDSGHAVLARIIYDAIPK